MTKKNNFCKNCCTKCWRPNMPDYTENFKSAGSRIKTPIHWIITAVALCFIGAYIIPEIQRNEAYNFKYYPPDIKHLKKKQEAIRISGIDFVSDVMKEKMQALGTKMKEICKDRSDDVIFAFQFGKGQGRREDHVFALCSQNTRVFGNTEVTARSEEFIMCTEEYDGELNQIRRPASVSLKAIDIDEWELIEYDVKEPKESCIVQHSIDVLESKWTT